MGNRVQGVIFDWAGTTVDFGCFAPLNVFLDVFRSRDIEITMKEARAPMGMLKIDHIRAILDMERVKKMWEGRFGRPHTEENVKELYNDFEPALTRILPNYADVLDGVIEVCDELKKDGIKIGSTTGYTAPMMEILSPRAGENGYKPDALVTAEEVSAGRPWPWMIFKNMEKLGIYPPRSVIKVGDTVTDILEGLNAGVWSVGVIAGSSEMGLTRDEYENLGKKDRKAAYRKTEKKYYRAGAHYVIDTMEDLPDLIVKIERKLRKEDD
ncbi:MAG: phosphonoacetaldehyde hydrolase [Synergistaceae bacterium]|nr:phosphonoacetaldehyde hydrolase [Synergistaceae bacterium]